MTAFSQNVTQTVIDTTHIRLAQCVARNVVADLVELDYLRAETLYRDSVDEARLKQLQLADSMVTVSRSEREYYKGEYETTSEQLKQSQAQVEDTKKTVKKQKWAIFGTSLVAVLALIGTIILAVK